MKRTQAELDALPDSAFCGPHRSFPVDEEGDVGPALQSLGRADPGDREGIRACVIRKAQEHHWALPEATQEQVDGGRRGKSEPPSLEYKLLPALPVTAVDERHVTGLFSVFGIVDYMDDVVHPGSFTKTFQERGPARTLFLWQHDLDSPPIAVIEPGGLREIPREALPEEVKSRWPSVTGGAEVVRTYLDTPRGNEVLAAIRAGAPLQQSYGFRAIKFDFAPVGETRVRHIREQFCGEVSDVNFGANEATRAQKAWLDLDTLVAQLRAHLAAFAPPEGKAGKRHNNADQQMLNEILRLVRQLGAEEAAEEQAESQGPDATDAAKSRAAVEALTQMKQRLAIFDLGTSLLLN